MAEGSADVRQAFNVRIAPQPGPQSLFLSTPADIAIYGGAAGGGKTFAELIEPLRHVSNKDFGAVIFRRTTPQITNEGALWDESTKLYPLLDAKPNQGVLYWTFPSGATVSFKHL
jgi:Terminase large subunit, T4likevirus-type, N-terminal